MSNIVSFSSTNLPAYLANRTALASINRDVVREASYAVLSIKGKVFTIVKGAEKKVLTRPDDADEVLQNINLSVLRANTKARVLYLKAYVEGDSDNAKPDCSSDDGVAPRADSSAPQSKKCAICPHAVWGTGNEGKGTKCSVVTRLAVADPDTLEPMLLRVPAGSRSNFADAVKAAETRGIPYNALVMKVGFDKEAPSPKLTFKPTGLLDDASYAKASAAYDSDAVRDIVGLGRAEPAAEVAADPVDVAELDAAIQAKKATDSAKASAKPAKPAPVVDMSELDTVVIAPTPAAAPVKAAKAPKAAPVTTDDSADSDLLGDLDSLLSASDD
jgi:hypothetical protein